MFTGLHELKNKTTHMVIGLMSGTSADGVDASLCELSGGGGDKLNVRLVAQYEQEYPEMLRERILGAGDSDGAKTSELCELNFLLGEAFASAANALIDSSGVPRSEIDLIGSHGQTISHLPPRTEAHSFQLGSTLQIGEPAVIAERTGITVISNFRARDMAAGGQGAPLVPFVDYLLYASADSTRVALNMGGISNVTWLPAKGGPEQTVAYDTGPGNMIIDEMVRYLTQGEQSYDRDGSIAASGRVNAGLLEELLKHPFLKRVPPKSTGREEFGVDYAIEKFEYGVHHGIMPRDIIATATEFTALSIARSLKAFLLSKGSIDELIASGGGVLNPVLMDALRRDLPGIKISTSDDYGVPLKAKESLAFAVLGRETALGRPSNLPSATGAKGPRVLGQITPA